ncbi:MAG: FKBP-type peptidyl-prolyl cis-trans isomerase [Flavipsychrobacter sp.]|nr:FKBP-type peptidyl-prolyl cis-trans isomerase [Chitinophagales bacterium]
MKQTLSILMVAGLYLLSGCTGSKKASKGNANAFKKTQSGIEYKMYRDNKATPLAKEGDLVDIHIHTKYNDSLIFDSRTNNNNKPVSLPLNKARFNGDLAEVLSMMSAGDSMVAMVAVDSLISSKQKTQPWMKPGNKITYVISMISVKTQEQINKEKNMASSEQMAIDEKLILKYLADNKIVGAKKTASGLYYIMRQPGKGDNAKAGQTVYVNYTGRTLDGNAFDSSVDPKFNHVEPLSFLLGRGNVIQGWDEGISLLNKGGKATLYIPSPLAYGKNSPTAAIPANSVLIFDVELVDVK